jgi:uncharacterized MAPEG superfamily protein
MSIAYWCLLFASILPYVTVAIAKLGGTYDNASPRKPDLYRGVAARADSAHKNGLEVFPFFAAAIVVASAADARAAHALLDEMALVWVALRVAYIAVYLADLATLRSVVWIAGWFLTIAIFTMPAWHA